MNKENNADTDSRDVEEVFDDLVEKEQSANEISAEAKAMADKSDTPEEEGEQSEQKPDADGSSSEAQAEEDEKPEDQSGADSGEQEDQSPEASAEEGSEEKGKKDDKLFWDKFKTEDDAKKSYDEAQGKIIEQGRKLNGLKSKVQENEEFLNSLDKVLLENPELAGQLKAVMSADTAGGEEEQKDDAEDNIDAKIDRKISERENQSKVKKERSEWIKNHPDFKNPEIGHKVLDLIEKEKMPLTAKTLDVAYSYVTNDQRIKEAKNKAVEREEVSDLERREASAVGGGEPSPKGKTPSDGNPFDDLVGESFNPNKI